MVIDYSLYLVTGRNLLPPGKSYLESLEESIQGGVTIVQIREKDTDTGEFLQIARDSKEICRRYKIPLLINDRIDIALAIQADGVHLGQTDMPVALARSLLPPGSIVGVSCNDIDQVQKAIKDGVDYVGIGSVWGTKTKALTSPIIGVRGVGSLLQALDGTQIKAVAIGGIKSTNLLRTLHGSVSTTNHSLDGVAIVSDIVASPEPRLAAQKLSTALRAFAASLKLHPMLISQNIANSELARSKIIDSVIHLIAKVKQDNPLIHQITNTVVATQSANATLALGASPIMASASEEMEDLAKIPGALLVNMGTLRPETVGGMIHAGFYANAAKKPIVYDPVGVGASDYRKAAAAELLDTWQPSVIKGNAGELSALAGSTEVESKGVDSVGSGFKDPVAFVKNLAKKERCVVVLSGTTDYISNGDTVVSLSNGHEILGRITGSGCLLGTCIATMCAAAAEMCAQDPNDGVLVNGDMFLAAIGGVLSLTIASELAMARGDVRGSGTFLPALIDELANLTPEVLRERTRLQILA